MPNRKRQRRSQGAVQRLADPAADGPTLQTRQFATRGAKDRGSSHLPLHAHDYAGEGMGQVTAATALLIIAAVYVVVLVFVLALVRAAADPDPLAERIHEDSDQRPGADRFWAVALTADDRALVERAFERDRP